MTTQFDVYHGDGSVRPMDPDVATEVPAIKRECGRYLADPELVEAVNLAICVGQPLLVTGEPGCGKTRLAWSVAAELGLGEPIEFYTRSSSRANDLLYRFDSVRRFHDIQAGDARAADPANYVEHEVLTAGASMTPLHRGRPACVPVHMAVWPEPHWRRCWR